MEAKVFLTLAVWKYFVAQGVSPAGPLARIICIVLTKREGYTGRISTQVLTRRTECSEVTTVKTEADQCSPNGIRSKQENA